LKLEIIASHKEKIFRRGGQGRRIRGGQNKRRQRKKEIQHTHYNLCSRPIRNGFRDYAAAAERAGADSDSGGDVEEKDEPEGCKEGVDCAVMVYCSTG
jgi:hypothetical protein